MHRAAFLVGVSLLLGACGGTAPVLTSGAPLVTSEATTPPSVAPGSPPTTNAPITTAVPPSDAPPAPSLAPPTEAPVTAPPVAPPPTTVAPGIGVPLEVGGQQVVMVVAFEQWPGTSTVKPAKGKVFRTVSVRIDAITLTTFDSADFKLRDLGLEKSYGWRPGRAPHLYSSTGLDAGHTYLGWITYEVPKAATGPFVLIYRPTFEAGATYRIPLT